MRKAYSISFCASSIFSFSRRQPIYCALANMELFSATSLFHSVSFSFQSDALDIDSPEKIRIIKKREII